MRFDIVHVPSFSVCFCMRSSALNPLEIGNFSLKRQGVLNTQWEGFEMVACLNFFHSSYGHIILTELNKNFLKENHYKTIDEPVRICRSFCRVLNVVRSDDQDFQKLGILASLPTFYSRMFTVSSFIHTLI